jgi:hypothetical protein
VERPPLRLVAVPARRLLVTKEICDMLDASSPYFPRAAAEAMLFRYCSGHFITVSRQKERSADLKKMVDVDEVWVMAFRTPRPGGRLLGRFVERNVFVGMELELREGLAGDAYATRAAQVISRWENILGSSQPVKSMNLDDYLGPVYRDMDTDDEHS